LSELFRDIFGEEGHQKVVGSQSSELAGVKRVFDASAYFMNTLTQAQLRFKEK
jgi:hypothetical protein